MQRAYLLILLFINVFCEAQNHAFLILGSDSNSVIESANIDFLNGKGTQSNSKGLFYVNRKITKIQISCIGYSSLTLNVATMKDTIVLQYATEGLEELNVTIKKRKYKSISPSRNISNILPKNYGTGAPISSILMKAVYIPNENKDTTQLISKIILYPTDYRTVSLVEKKKFYKQDNQKYAPFKINLYTVDTLIGIPIKQIFTEDIVVQLKQGQSELIYELPVDQQINFPREGIFIAFSSFEKSYYDEIGFKSGPAFKTIGISGNSKFQVFQKNFAYCETAEDCKWFRDQYM